MKPRNANKYIDKKIEGSKQIGLVLTYSARI